MSKDIRSFFKALPKHNNNVGRGTTTVSTPTTQSGKTKPSKRSSTRRILDSDDEQEEEDAFETSKPSSAVTKTPTKSKKPGNLVPITNLEDVIPNRQIKRSALPDANNSSISSADESRVIKLRSSTSSVSSPKTIRNSKKAKNIANKSVTELEVAIHEDDSFAKVLRQHDIDSKATKQTKKNRGKTDEGKCVKSTCGGSTSKVTDMECAVHEDEKFGKMLQMHSSSSVSTFLNDDDVDDDQFDELIQQMEMSTGTSSPAKSSKRSRSSNEKTSPSKRTKLEHTDSGIDTGQDQFERKRNQYQMYQSYLQRAPPKHYGQKSLPEGAPNCLAGLCFLKTGVLDSLDHDDFNSLVVKHGGRTVTAVSRKVNYIVVGEEPGPSKMQKATEFHIATITEDELLDMILEKSGKPKRYTVAVKEEEEEDVPPPIVKVEPAARKSEMKPMKNSNTQHLVATPPSSHPVSSHPVVTIRNDTLQLCDKYRPTSISEIIGQQQPTSCMNKLKRWLMHWQQCEHQGKHSQKKGSASSFGGGDGSNFKCALLSGPPGVGKTTTATLVAKELGFDVVELNASDTRSKRLLHEEVGQLLSTNSIAGYASGTTGGVSVKRVLLMDEVDGMAGNEDRGGIQELIQLIKTTRIPIICMCNDRQHQKIRSLSFYCYDLRFIKPKPEMIREAMLDICKKEHQTVDTPQLNEIILATGCDIRQTLNQLSILVAAETQTTSGGSSVRPNCSKDVSVNIWDVCRKVFSTAERRQMSLTEKFRLFYHDYSLGPLFIQENYLQYQPQNAKNDKDVLKSAITSAEALSCGDVVDRQMRTTNQWSLLEACALFSSVLPGHYMCGQMKPINFPAWLGHNSSRNKQRRIIAEISAHTRKTISGGKLAVQLDYFGALRDAVYTPLRSQGMSGVNQAVDVMCTYNLMREDFDSLLQCQLRKKNPATASAIDSKVKAAFTRTYNKRVALVTHRPKKSIRLHDDDDDVYGGDDDQQQVEDDETIDKDDLIKVKSTTVKKGSSTSSSKGKSSAGTSSKGRSTKAKK